MQQLIEFFKRLFGVAIKETVEKLPPLEEKEVKLVNIEAENILPKNLRLNVLHKLAISNPKKNKLTGLTLSESFDILVDTFKNHCFIFEVNTKLRAAHFWAQMAHETGGFRWYGELGGKSYFNRYEGRKDLGNVEKGDGYEYRGRGIIQITGRYNYKRYGDKLGIDLINNPDKASNPEVAMLVALMYWKDRNINKWADTDDIRGVTKAINGGYNGLSSRRQYLRKLK